MLPQVQPKIDGSCSKMVVFGAGHHVATSPAQDRWVLLEDGGLWPRACSTVAWNGEECAELVGMALWWKDHRWVVLALIEKGRPKVKAIPGFVWRQNCRKHKSCNFK